MAYPARPFLQCHPDRLAVMARLFGLRPEPVERCRVLEIGCGDGVNLMASSLVLPGAAFRGIDLSGAAISHCLTEGMTVDGIAVSELMAAYRELKERG